MVGVGHMRISYCSFTFASAALPTYLHSPLLPPCMPMILYLDSPICMAAVAEGQNQWLSPF
jgi:hypothetical protein